MYKRQYQENPRGLGHAVGCAREAVGDEPFAVLLPDELRGDAGLLRLLIDSSEATGSSAIELKRVPSLGHLTTTERYDTGTPFGWLTAVIDIALRRGDTGPQLREWLSGRL